MGYEITSINDSEGWIHICAEDSSDSPDAFIALVKTIATSVAGEIFSVGDTQYKITNLPFDLVFQWDDLFGIVIINSNRSERDDVLRFLKNYGIE